MAELMTKEIPNTRLNAVCANMDQICGFYEDVSTWRK